MYRNKVYKGLIFHCTYSFWGLCRQILTGALSLDPVGGLPPPRPRFPRLPSRSRHCILVPVVLFNQSLFCSAQKQWQRCTKYIVSRTARLKEWH